MRILSLFLIGAALASGQTTINGGRTILGPWDASGATATKPDRVVTSDPATCAVGETIFRSDTGRPKRCTALNTWSDELPTASAGTIGGVRVGANLSIDGSGILSASASGTTCDPFDVTKLCFVEEFLTGSNTSGATAASGIGVTAISSGTFGHVAVNSVLGEANRPGVFRIQSTSSAGSGGIVRVANNSTTNNVNLSDWMNEEWDAKWVAKPTSATDTRMRIGLSGAASTIVPATSELFMGFRFDPDAAFSDNTKNTTGSWVAQFCGYSGGTCADTAGVYKVLNILPDTNWHLFRVVRSGTTVTWYLDSTAVATMCASGCDMTTPTITSQTTVNTMTPAVIFGITGTTTRGMYLDYLSLMISGLTRY